MTTNTIEPRLYAVTFDVPVTITVDAEDPDAALGVALARLSDVGVAAPCDDVQVWEPRGHPTVTLEDD